MNPYDLEAMRSVDVQTVDPASLSEITDIDIDPELPFIQKALAYLRQTKNAYCCRCEGVIIKTIHNKNTNSTINDCMEGFFHTV